MGNRKIIIDKKNKNAVELQLEFLCTIINKIKNNKSTVGFEILNEPQIFRQSEFKKVSDYHTFMVENLGKLTYKAFFFSYAVSNSLKAINFPW